MSSIISTKIAVCGMGSVGKSALTIQFLQNRFITEYDPTIEELYRKQIGVDDEAVMLEILDTAGQEEYSAMREHYLEKGEGFLFVYSILNRDSFITIPKYIKLLQQVKDSQQEKIGNNENFVQPPIVIVGNKIDLEKKRKVKRQELEKLAQTFKCPCFEASAKTRKNVEESYFQLVREIRNFHLKKSNSKKKKKKRCSIL
ncbi:ras gtpase-related [Anaeramoeba flamelloides]|uniref:Ras gtpase-related n=1 Tax=Anaeramoeba flamelloides TaxID=1746091 RepID=A0ABQ8YX75_9EUKA|nr:ras gtpase-related [Anaeramoeba flamelloides]